MANGATSYWHELADGRVHCDVCPRACRLREGLANGIRHAYTGNVFDATGGSTYCAGCGERVIERDWYRLGDYRLTDIGRCEACETTLPGVFAGRPGVWGRRRLPVRLAR